METYSQFSPTPMDTKGLGLSNQQDWLVAPCSRNRDSDCLAESNWESQLETFRNAQAESEDSNEDECPDFEVHRFGHWGNGWFEIVLVRPDSNCAKVAQEIECALADYPVLDESDFSDREYKEAQEVWEHCYNTKQRIEYIERHRSQFDFDSMEAMMGCVRGKFFNGYASELINR